MTRTLAALLFLSVAGLIALPMAREYAHAAPAAQTGNLLVSNLSETQSGDPAISNTRYQAQCVTSSDTDNIKLQTVRVIIAAAADVTLDMDIYSSTSDSKPNAKLADFATANASNTGNLDFVNQTGYTLDSNAGYCLVVSSSSASLVRIRATSSTSQTTGSGINMSIDDTGAVSTDGGINWNANSNPRLFGLYGETEPPDITLSGNRSEDGVSVSLSWTRYAGAGFQSYRVVICAEANFDDGGCSSSLFDTGAIADNLSTGPILVTGMQPETGYAAVLTVSVRIQNADYAYRSFVILPGRPQATPVPVSTPRMNFTGFLHDPPEDRASITGRSCTSSSP